MIWRFIDDRIRLYWKTMRHIRANHNCFVNESPKHKWWHKGLRLTMIITTRCNLHCDYCPMFLTDSKYPKYKESTLEEWKNYFTYFPDWCSEIVISGGEPTLVPYLPDLINFLTDRGHHVIVYSNLLKPETFYGVKDSFKFCILPTFHHSDDSVRFWSAYDKLKKRFRVVSQEMEDKKFKFSLFKEKYTKEFFVEKDNVFHIAPDAPKTNKMYLGAHSLYKDGQ